MIKKYLFPINAIHRDKSVVLLYSPEEVRNFCKGKNVDVEWVYYTYNWRTYNWRTYERVTHYNDYILRDDCGKIVDKKDFYLPHPNWKNRKGNFEYRNGPVPRLYGGTGYCPRHNATAKKNSGKGARLRYETNVAEFEGRKPRLNGLRD